MRDSKESLRQKPRPAGRGILSACKARAGVGAGKSGTPFKNNIREADTQML